MSRTVARAEPLVACIADNIASRNNLRDLHLCVWDFLFRLDVLRQFDFLRGILFDPSAVETKAEELPEDLQFLVRSRLSDLPASSVSIQVLNGNLLDFSEPEQIPLPSESRHLQNFETLTAMTVDYATVGAKMQEIYPYLKGWTPTCPSK